MLLFPPAELGYILAYSPAKKEVYYGRSRETVPAGSFGKAP